MAVNGATGEPGSGPARNGVSSTAGPLAAAGPETGIGPPATIGPVRSGIRDLNPGYFAVVMATGIVSRAMKLDGWAYLSGLLLVLTVIAYVTLVAAYGWRLVAYRSEFAADATDPRKAFAFFTFVAGSNVLGAGLAPHGYTWATVVLLAGSGLAWLLLSYGVPLVLVTRHATRPPLASANGTWFLWVVGTQSIAVAATSLPPPASDFQAALSVACWSVGVVLYLIVAVTVVTSLLQYTVAPAQLTPPYWVFMGATAISVLAGAQILKLPAHPLVAAMRPAVAGASFVLWAFGTWLIPLLIALGVWRHVIRRLRLAYEPGLWSIVFPIGMYGVASRQLGAALHVPWLVTLGADEAWVALAAWAAVLLAMVGAAVNRPLRTLTSRPAADRG
jgi:tellurite resistance protein TehA-like permease